MTIRDFIEFFQDKSDETPVEVLKRCSDNVDEDEGRGIYTLEFYITSKDAVGKVYIRLEDTE